MSHHVHDDVAQGNMVKDPVCGMDVDPDSAAYRSEHDGHEYYFCSEHCRAKFEADPYSYLQPAHRPPRRPPRRPPGRPLSGPARCIRRFVDRVQAPARSAAWRSSPSP